MKKIVIGILFVGLVFLSGRVFSIQIGCTNTCQPGETQSAPPACICTPSGGTPSGGTPNGGTPSGGTPSGGAPSGGTPSGGDQGNNNTGTCDPERVYTITSSLTGCCPSPLVDGKCNAVAYDDIGITMNTECLLNGQCKLNVYKVFGIRKSNPNPTVGGLFQDIVLAATSFVGTVVVIALVVSGLIFAFGSISGKDTKKAKTIMIDCLIGLLLVMGSYTIIRLIQFIATAGS